jgi:hypothetical protein
VLYDQSNGKAIWSINQVHVNNAVAFLQKSDGNFVVYDSTGVKKWSTTGGKPGSEFAVQNDGNRVLRDANGNVPWKSNTRQP